MPVSARIAASTTVTFAKEFLMRSAGIRCAVCIVAWLVLTAGPTSLLHGQSGPALIIRGGTVIDGTGAPASPATSILVRGTTIQAIGPDKDLGAPKDARVIDAAGKYILPGLIDSHVHYLEWETPYYPYFGVTTIFDLGNLTEWIVAQREAWKAGRIPGARLYTTGNHLNGPAKPGDELRSADRAGWTHIVDNRASTLDALNTLASFKVDALKVQERLNEESLRTIVEYAGQHRLAIVGHTVNARDAALMGIRFVEHMIPLARATSSSGSGRDRDMDPAKFDDLITLLVEKQVVVNPTLALLHVQASRNNAAYRRQDEAMLPTFTGVPQSVRDIWMHEFYEDVKLRDAKMAGFPNTVAFLKKFADRGGRILSGTDAGRRVMPGQSLHREMDMLVKDVGLSPMEAIKTSTLYPAEFFGLDKEIGTIAVGKKADLLIVDADPLADIANTQKIAVVVLDGKVLDRSARSLTYKNPLPRPVSDEPIPFIESVAPLRIGQGQTAATITIRGKNFIADSVVQVGDVRLVPRRVQDGVLTVAVPPAVARTVGTHQIEVINPLPGGGQSNSRYIFVDYAAAPPPSSAAAAKPHE
jgi:imidazolonepropionase-like amidohydrolase